MYSDNLNSNEHAMMSFNIFISQTEPLPSILHYYITFQSQERLYNQQCHHYPHHHPHHHLHHLPHHHPYKHIHHLRHHHLQDYHVLILRLLNLFSLFLYFYISILLLSLFSSLVFVLIKVKS